jgi:hypothetical protein
VFLNAEHLEINNAAAGGETRKRLKVSVAAERSYEDGISIETEKRHVF